MQTDAGKPAAERKGFLRMAGGPAAALAALVLALGLGTSAGLARAQGRQENARMQEKIAQVRLVSHAKCCLVEREQMSEDAAHRYIEKRAMDTRRSRAEIAQEILDSYED